MEDIDDLCNEGNDGEASGTCVTSQYTCEMCGKCCKNKSLLTQHIAAHMERPYNCNECDKSFRVKKSFDNHMDTEHSGRLTCHQCNIIYKREIFFKRHLMDIHSVDPSCDVCSLIFEDISDYRAHLNIHNDNTFKCVFCGKRFKGERYLNCHIADKHTLKCEHCEQSFQTNILLMRHMEVEHCEQTLAVKCDHCELTFRDNKTLALHLKKVKREEKEKNYEIKIENVQCGICEVLLDSDIASENHFDEFHPHKTHQYKCMKCSLVHKTWKTAYFHWKNHNRREIFKCFVCQQMFCSDANLRRHYGLKHPSFTLGYKCKECNKIFNMKRPLERHMISHKGKGTFSDCHICKSFVTTSNLKRHYKKVHPGCKMDKFRCGECDMFFLKYRSFRAHSEFHKQPKNYEFVECHICQVVYGVKRQVIRHYETKHSGVEPVVKYRCIVCKATFPVFGELKEHMKIHIESVPVKDENEEDSEINDTSEDEDVQDSIEIGLYECDQCVEVFVSFHELEYHRKVHIEKVDETGELSITDEEMSNDQNYTEIALYQCEKCNEFFESFDELEIHGKVHITSLDGVNVYKCVDCIAVFNSDVELEKHLKTHIQSEEYIKSVSEQKVNAFECLVCKQVFESNDDLEIHFKVHIKLE